MIMTVLTIMMLKRAVWMDDYVFEDDDEEKWLALDSGQSIIGPVVIMMILLMIALIIMLRVMIVASMMTMM